MLSTVAGVMILWWLCYVPMVHASHLFSVFGLFYHLTACYNSSQLHLFSCEDLISIRWSTHVLLHMVRTHRRGEKELDPALIFPVVFPSWFRLFYLQCKWCTDHGSNYSLSHRNWKYWSTWATSIEGTSKIHGCSASGGDFFFPVRDVAFRLHFSLIFSIHSLNAWEWITTPPSFAPPRGNENMTAYDTTIRANQQVGSFLWTASYDFENDMLDGSVYILPSKLTCLLGS